jgi:SAM-dependent methyltransferase
MYEVSPRFRQEEFDFSLADAEFDEIAPVYDETRGVLDDETSSGIKEMLEKHGCHSILEIGVGTGRVALPLMKDDFQVTGVDLSRKMMERASGKGIKNLVLAEGSQVPFKNKTFDASMMAHVFHILQDPISVLQESARVSKIGVFALVRKGGMGHWWSYFRPEGGLSGDRSDGPDSGDQTSDDRTREYFEERRKSFRAIAEKYGWNLEKQRQLHPRNWQGEQEILTKYPPDDLMTVSDVEITLSLEDRLARFEKNAYSYMMGMPEEMRQEIISEIRANAAKFPERASQPRHVIYQLAMWGPEALTA